LVSLIALAVVATLAGHTSLVAIAHFGRLRGHKLGHPLGFRDGHLPCANTLANLFAELDADHLDRLIGDWLSDRHPSGFDHLALDGKVARGSRVVMAIGRLPAQPVDGGGIPAGLPLALHPPPRPDTLAEQAGGVHLRPLAVEHRPEHPHRVPLPLARGHTSRSLYLVHRASPWPEPRGHF
jgi:hypothetical protein